MIEIFASSLKESFNDEDFVRAMYLVSEESATRLRRFRFKEDTLRSLFGELLIRHWCHIHFGMLHKEVPIKRDRFSKPFIQGYCVDYSIAHSGDWVVCAINSSGLKIGIDLEQIKSIDLCVAERCFSTQEFLALQQLPPAVRTSYFYTLWTLKEAYVKYLGTGLLTPLNSFSFDITPHQITITDSAHKTIPQFCRYAISDGYACAVCAKDGEFPDQVNVILPQALLPPL